MANSVVLRFLTWALLWGLAAMPATQAAPPAAAIGHLFDESVLADNNFQTLSRTRQLSADERFEVLLRWVFPTGGQTVRMTGETFGDGLRPGHNVQSPIFDLLDVARDLGRMQELADRVHSLEASPSPESESQRRALRAIRALVSLELADTQAADTAIVQLMELVRVAPAGPARDKWPELLVASRGVSRFPAQGTVHDLVGLMREVLNSYPPQGDDEAIRNLVCGLQGVVRWQGATATELDDPRTNTYAEWMPVAGSASRARGAGLARVDWRRNARNELQHVTGHLDDFLLYAIPMYGNFEITGDIVGYGQTQLFLGGQILGAAAGHQRATGIFRSGVVPQPIDPLLQWPSHWVRFRAQFTEDRLRLYLNGRLVSDEPLNPTRSPWIGFHSYWWAEAAVRNVQIAGSPRIPTSVAMSESPAMEEWRSYFHQSVGFEGASWRCTRDADGQFQIIGRQATDIGNTPYESLLQYVRPLQDGDRVEYDFYCDQAVEAAHPALGTRVFVIRPDGVMLHEVTAGEFEPSELPPDNLQPLDAKSGESRPTPLKLGKWNHVEMGIEGDTATLVLNGVRVASMGVSPSAPIPFGLFHFSERSEARARNLQFQGRWPQDLPSLEDQTLADLTTSRLDQRRSQLTASIVHDFSTDGLKSPLVKVATAQTANHAPQSTGVVAKSQSTGPWEATELSAGVELHGDFDVEVAFDSMERVGTGWAGIMLNVEFQDASEHLARAMLGKDPVAPGPMLQASLSDLRNGERFYDHFDIVECDATSGRLRIARRGNHLHYLFAEGDSPTFRVFGDRKVSTAPTKAGGIKLVLNTHAGAQCRVTWKSVTAQAEKIVEHPSAPTRTVAELDQTRDQLQSEFHHDFAAGELKTDRFIQRLSTPDDIQKVDQGVRMSITGRGTWSFTQLHCKTHFSGDFDLELEFEQMQMTGNEHAGVILSANLDDPTRSCYRLVRDRDVLQRQNVHSQLQTTTPQGTTFQAFEGLALAPDRGRMRIARRGTAIYFLIAEGDSEYRIVNQQPCRKVDSTRMGIKLECLVNGTATSRVVWKKLKLRADQVE